MVKRGDIRERYGIEGNGFDDCCVSFWCCCCALVQQDNEVRIRQRNAQPIDQDYYSQPSMQDYRGNERFDFIQRYVFGLTRILIARGQDATMPSLDVKLRGGVELYFQDSNIWNRYHEDVYSYPRVIYGLQLIVSF